jgi:hypothetical protein
LWEILLVRAEVYALGSVLGRDAVLSQLGGLPDDPNGLNGWTNWLANGTYTLDQEVGSFISSPEYLARF